jgi:phospholipid-binding lipoprotein MlaA
MLRLGEGPRFSSDFRRLGFVEVLSVTHAVSRSWRGLVLAIALLSLTACAHRPPASDKAAVAAYEERDDPLEPLNRTMFKVDQGMEAVLFRPIVWTYRKILPEWVRRRITLLMDNVRAPITLVNDLLQGEGKRASITFGRIVMNTTLGLGGMFDVATRNGLPGHTEDFGQTLAVWGLQPGSYLYLPVLGPTGIRDGIGLAVDSFAFDWVAWYSYNPHNLQWVQYAELGVTLVDTKSETQETTDELKKSSIDYYAALRSAYRQYRAKEIRNGRPAPTGETPNFEGEEGDPFAEEPSAATKKP